MQKRLLTILVLVLTVSAAAFTGCGRGPAKGKLQIMYSGNLRGNVAPCGWHDKKGGVARWATFIHRQGNPDAAWMTVDAGNYVDRGKGGTGCSDKCQFMVTSYKDLHYDVLNLGKQEVWMGYETLQAMLDTTKNTDFVSANLIDRTSRKPLAHPTLIKDYGSMRVGVIGFLSETDFPKGSTLLDSTKLEVMPLMEAAKKYLPNLIKKTDAVVVLAELSSERLDSLLKIYPDIDVVISTGGLKSGESPAVIGKTRVLGTGSSGYNGHWAMLEFNPSWGDSVGFSSFMDPLTDSYEESGVWSQKLAAFEAKPPTPSQPAVTTAPKSPPGTPGSAVPQQQSPMQLKPQPTTAPTTSNKG